MLQNPLQKIHFNTSLVYQLSSVKWGTIYMHPHTQLCIHGTYASMQLFKACPRCMEDCCLNICILENVQTIVISLENTCHNTQVDNFKISCTILYRSWTIQYLYINNKKPVYSQLEYTYSIHAPEGWTTVHDNWWYAVIRYIHHISNNKDTMCSVLYAALREIISAINLWSPKKNNLILCTLCAIIS